MTSVPKEVNLVGSDGQSATFDIQGYPTAIVNSIRRSLLSYVRSVAMVAEPSESSSIRIIENTSRLNNQFLSLRLSLIPVCIPPVPRGGEIKTLDRYEIRLEKEATESGIYNVTTDDIRVYDTKEKGFLPRSYVSKLFPREDVYSIRSGERPPPGMTHANNPFLLVPLRGPRGEKEGEKVKLVAKLRTETGSKHACFSPVSCATYEIIPIDDTDPGRALDMAGKRDKSKYRFVVESVTTRSPESLFIEGIDEVIRKIRDLRTKINTASRNKGKGPECEIHQDGQELRFRFINEDHTAGLLFQEYLIRQVKTKEPDVLSEWFVGYKIPHPLMPEMIVRVRVPETIGKETDSSIAEIVDNWIDPGFQEASEHLENIKKTVKETISPESLTHPLSMLHNDDFVPPVERVTSIDETLAKIAAVSPSA